MAEERFEYRLVSRTDLYELGRDCELDEYYLGIPVGIPHFDWDEYYRLSEDEYRSLIADPRAARAFADRCRAHEMDDRLILPQRPIRGTPWQPR
jgi:hypothetical protein